ncbi:MAG: DsbE family thiol:disulfide interchange protein [Erythrobacter sp.]
MRWMKWIPLALFAFFLGLAGYQLSQPKVDTVRSQMIGKPLPEFELPPATDLLPGASRADLLGGKPRLLNIWASWCLPCIAEAPQLEALRDQGVEIIGVAVRDKPDDVNDFLSRYGNPYTKIGADRISQVQFEIGSSGVPESYVIDARGIIQYQHIGDIRPEHVALLLEEMRKAGE